MRTMSNSIVLRKSLASKRPAHIAQDSSCQRAHWPRHREVCRAIREQQANLSKRDNDLMDELSGWLAFHQTACIMAAVGADSETELYVLATVCALMPQ